MDVFDLAHTARYSTAESAEMKPILISQQLLAESVAERWRKLYGSSPSTDWKAEVQKQLDSLESPTPEAVNAVIGNNSWTQLSCDSCGRYVDIAVQVGDELDYESHTVTLCTSCVKEAAVLVGLCTL